MLRDDAGLAVTELVRRAAFDLGFTATRRSPPPGSAPAGDPWLPPRLALEARALVAHRPTSSSST